MRGRKHCVFVEGKWVAEYRSGREALAYARSLVANGPADSIDHPPSKSESHKDGTSNTGRVEVVPHFAVIVNFGRKVESQWITTLNRLGTECGSRVETILPSMTFGRWQRGGP